MDWNFYRHIENWHKALWLSKLLCKIGRHDYEYYRPGKIFGSGELVCFYCCQRKISTNSNLRNKRRDEINETINLPENDIEISEHLTNQIGLADPKLTEKLINTFKNSATESVKEHLNHGRSVSGVIDDKHTKIYPPEPQNK